MKKNLLVLLILSFSAISAFSQATFEWIGGGGNSNWNNSANWNLIMGSDGDGIPDADDNAIVLEDGAFETTTVLVNGNFSINELTISNQDLSGTFSSTAQVVVTTGNSLDVGSTVTLDNSGGTARLTVVGTLLIAANFSGSGTLNPITGSTIIYDGAGSQIIRPAIAYYNLSINKSSGTATLSGNITINNNYTNTLGTFSQTSGTVTFAGSGGIISGAGTTTMRNVLFEGSTSNTTTGTFQISSQGVVTLGDNVTLSGSGNFVLRSTSASQTARIDEVPSTSNITAQITIERFLSDITPAPGEGTEDYRYIASPIAITVAEWQDDLYITGFTGGNPCPVGCLNNNNMYEYIESESGVSGEGWIEFPSSSTDNIPIGRGFAFYQRDEDSPETIDATGVPVVGDFSSFSLTYTPSTQGDVDAFNTANETSLTLNEYRLGNDGWNLIGNPYPSAINWDRDGDLSLYTYSNLTGVAYVKDNGGVIGTKAIYLTHNGSISTGGWNGVIAQGQAFFVQANGGSPSLTMTESMKTSSATFVRKAAPDNVLRVYMNLDEYKGDEMVLHFREDATKQYESDIDAIKLLNDHVNFSSLVEEGINLVINSLPIENCIEIPMNIYPNNPNGTYTMSFAGWETFNYGIEVSLVDNYTGNTTEITESTVYEFSINNDAASKGSERFSIAINKVLSTDLTINSTSDICIGEDGLISIPSPDPNVLYKAYIDGNVVAEGSSEGDALELNIPSSELNENVLISLKASTECFSEVEISNEIAINVMQLPSTDITVNSTNEICFGEQSSVILENPETGIIYRVLMEGSVIGEQTGASEPLTFEINADQLSRDVSLILTATSECVENMEILEPINITVNELPTPQIDRLDEYTLRSNYTEGNQWYFNDEAIEGATGTELQIMETGVYSLEVTNENSCSARIDETLTVTSINDELAEFGAKVYPVPFDDILTIDASKLHNGHIMITSITGKMRHTQHLKKNINNIDLSGLESGLYLLKIKDKSKEVIVRIIKK